MTPILCTRLSGVRGTLTDKLEAAPKLIKPSYRTPARRSRLALPRAIPAGGRGASLPIRWRPSRPLTLLGRARENAQVARQILSNQKGRRVRRLCEHDRALGGERFAEQNSIRDFDPGGGVQFAAVVTSSPYPRPLDPPQGAGRGASDPRQRKARAEANDQRTSKRRNRPSPWPMLRNATVSEEDTP
jgi:hypothetical protein